MDFSAESACFDAHPPILPVAGRAGLNTKRWVAAMCEATHVSLGEITPGNPVFWLVRGVAAADSTSNARAPAEKKSSTEGPIGHLHRDMWGGEMSCSGLFQLQQLA